MLYLFRVVDMDDSFEQCSTNTGSRSLVKVFFPLIIYIISLNCWRTWSNKLFFPCHYLFMVVKQEQSCRLAVLEMFCIFVWKRMCPFKFLLLNGYRCCLLAVWARQYRRLLLRLQLRYCLFFLFVFEIEGLAQVNFWTTLKFFVFEVHSFKIPCLDLIRICGKLWYSIEHFFDFFILVSNDNN